MKKIMISILMLIILGACGNNEDNIDINQPNNNANEEDVAINNAENVETNDEETSEEPQSDQDYFKEKMDTLNFFDFELEVEYANDKKYEAEVDKNSNGTFDVEIEDELNGVKVKGREAFDDIFPRLEKLDLTSESANDEVMEQILQAFDLSDNFIEFEVEIEFDDGVELKFETPNS